MKTVLVGRGGLLTKTVLQTLMETPYRPELVLIQERVSGYPNLTRLLCERYGITHLVGPTVQASSFLSLLDDLQPDLIVVASLGEILKKPFLGGRTVWNVHMGLLPDYKGPLTNFWLIKEGSDHFGCTIHQIDEGIDTGPILKRVEKDFTGQVHAFEFIQANYLMAAEALVQTIGEWEAGYTRPIPQVPGEGSYYPKFKHGDLKLDLGMEVVKLHKVINRLQYYGVPWLVWDGKTYEVFASNLLLEIEKAVEEIRLETVGPGRAALSNPTGFLELVIQSTNDHQRS